jgi:hypothetical protein
MRAPMGLALLLIMAVAACMPRGPVIDVTGNKPQGVGGTIAGAVRARLGEPLPGRLVTAVNVATGARVQATTAANGGYTIQVPVGTYRLELQLQQGEAIEKQPPDTEISASDMDADRDFVVVRQP